MTAVSPRLRMFAGPNGSGKSTLKDILQPDWLGVYINADDVEAEIRAKGHLALAAYGVETTLQELLDFFTRSEFLRAQGLLQAAQQIRLSDGCVDFAAVPINSYFVSVLVDFIRHDLLPRGISFTFEIVMSSKDKVDFLCKARGKGFRT